MEVQAAWLSDMRNGTEEERTLAPRFYAGAIQDVLASETAGRPVFKDVPFIKLIIPGDRSVVIDRPALIDEEPINPNQRADNIRFPKHWARFKANQDQAGAVGTPLKELPMFNRALVDTLGAQNIRTLEQLAELSDTSATKLMGGLSWRQKARDVIASASGSAAVLQMRAQMDAKTDENEELRKLLKDQAERLERLEAKSVKAKAS